MCLVIARRSRGDSRQNSSLFEVYLDCFATARNDGLSSRVSETNVAIQIVNRLVWFQSGLRSNRFADIASLRSQWRVLKCWEALSNQLKRNNQSVDRTWLNQRNSQNRQYHIARAEFRVFTHIIQWGLRNPSLNERNRKPRETNSESRCDIHIWIYHICRVDFENLECNDQSIDRTWFSQRDKKDHIGHKFPPHIRVSQDWVERSDCNHSLTNCGSDPRQCNRKSSS